MASSQDISSSETNSIKLVENISPDGYELKKYLLKKWIYDNDHTQPYVAKALGLSPDEFKRKLREREKFNKEQITRLVYLMEAEAAFNVLVFPTNRQRRKIWWEVFGKYKVKEKLNE